MQNFILRPLGGRLFICKQRETWTIKKGEKIVPDFALRYVMEHRELLVHTDLVKLPRNCHGAR